MTPVLQRTSLSGVSDGILEVYDRWKVDFKEEKKATDIIVGHGGPHWHVPPLTHAVSITHRTTTEREHKSRG